jgi:type I restriction enzyme S subunit
MSFSRYERYKDSGVEWLGEVPEHWDAYPLKRIAHLQSGETINSDSIDTTGDYPVFGGNGLRGFTSNYTHEGLHVLIGRQGALCGNVNYADGRFFASEHAIVVTPKRCVDLTWLGELLRAMDLNQYSIASAQPGLSVDNVTKLSIPIPSNFEQIAVGNFLRQETAKIDALIEEQRRLIELLKEKRQAVISHAVTKGLNPKALMKESGIEWLGAVPCHWTVMPVRYKYDVALGKMLDEKRMIGESLHPYLRNVDVQWNRINLNDLPEMDFDDEERERYSVRSGDLLVCEGGDSGRAAYLSDDVQAIFYQKALLRLRPRFIKDDSPKFMLYVLWNANLQGRFVASQNKATIGHLPAEALRAYCFPFPGLAEQTEIVSFLDGFTEQLDALTSLAEQGIALLQERRSALISAAVTGKIDVRNYVPKEAA